MSPSRRARRVLLIVVPVLVLALGAGGYAAWRYTDLFTPDRLCGGAVATGDVQKVLGGGRVKVVDSSFSKDRADPQAACIIDVGEDGGTAAELTLRTHRVDALDRDVTVDPGMSQPDRGPVGAFSNGTGWLMLPPGCRLPVRDRDRLAARDADVLTVDVHHRGKLTDWQDVPAKETPSPETRAALARLAAGFGATVAKSSGCGTADVPDVHLTAAGTSWQPAVDGQLCGLPGTGTGTGAQGLVQRVSDPAAPIRTCWVYDGTLNEPAIRFTSSTAARYPALVAGPESLDKPLPAGWRGKGSDSVVLAPCGNGNVFLHLAGRDPYLDPAVPTRDTPLFRSWADATGTGLGCGPLTPG
ncbi:hypothetical protein J5Y04_11405 [Kitasatospora sp. RG8]|uniref:hypothetical protein n=1 Tax=Kitasatospora sp. RG8 TaxID=2820815 RepID=UPI001AE0E247|nr:hypothetical protein [Kitasatospora sp. RG8]MBP0450155.1 hypothetical protein [Kitasatospora sp. RG8]